MDIAGTAVASQGGADMDGAALTHWDKPGKGQKCSPIEHNTALKADKEFKACRKHYEHQARHNHWGANAISILLVASGAAVGLTGLAGHLSDELNASLGVAVILLEGANRVFTPAQRAARAQRTAHQLRFEQWRWRRGVSPYCGTDRDQKYVNKGFEILKRTFAEEDHDPLNGNSEPPTAPSSDPSEGDPYPVGGPSGRAVGGRNV